MKLRRLIAPIMALYLSVCAMRSPYISCSIFAAAKEEQTAECVSFDEETGTLTLKGNVSTKDVKAYRENEKVKAIIAEEGAILPENCNSLFIGSRALKIDLSKADTSNVTNMNRMFSSCTSLVEIDLSGIDTSNVTNMFAMFSGCSSLESLALSFFNTSNVTDMGYMFNKCSSLTSPNLSGFDTSNVTNMEFMFYECSSLTSLNLSGFDTSNATDMFGMFGYCSSLESLDLSFFNTSNVTNMELMFFACSSLTSLDLSGFDTSNVIDMLGIFGNCLALKTIYAGKAFNVPTEKSKGMFSHCVNLVGGNGTKFDESKIDAAYAHIDEPDDPGYFTEKKKDPGSEPVQTAKKLGDPTDDGIIDAVDASNILSQYTKYSTGAAEPTAEDLAVCDVNGDGYIDSVDASKVLAYYSYVSTDGTLSFTEFLEKQTA